ncbi:hypothetical protein [Peribacillus simplex]
MKNKEKVFRENENKTPLVVSEVGLTNEDYIQLFVPDSPYSIIIG